MKREIMLLFLLLFVCGFGIDFLHGSESGIDIYTDLRSSHAATQYLVDKCTKNRIRRLIPSLSGGDGSVLWVTDKEDYYSDPVYQNAIANGYDALESMISYAHSKGVEVYPSVIVSSGGRIVKTNPVWESRNKYGNPGGTANFNALAFSYSSARQQKIALLMDLVNNYNIDGIYLDYCRYFEGYGYDQPIINECIDNYGFDPRYVSVGSSNYYIFAGVRAHTVTTFVQEFRAAVQASGRNIRIGTLADHRYNLTLDPITYGRDFPTWAQNGLVEDVFLANYTETPINNIRSVVQNVRKAVGSQVTLNATLCTWSNHLSSEDDFLVATREAVSGGADNLWIYREDFLTNQNLWFAAESAYFKFNRLIYAGQSPSRIIEYNASSVSGDPTTVSPAWAQYGTVMTDQGDYLLQDTTEIAGQQTSEYRSSVTAALLFKYGSGYYGIGFRVKPVGDIPSSGPYKQLYVAWSDDVYKYCVTIDRDTDDNGSGTSGGIRSGSNLYQVLRGIDWSTPHSVFITYHPDDNTFHFYLDGTYVDYVQNQYLQYGSSDSGLRGAVQFGDGTTSGSDVAAQWYSVGVYDPVFCGDNRESYPGGDINQDCVVDTEDLLKMSSEWLRDTRP